MSLYDGPPILAGQIWLVAPIASQVAEALATADLDEHQASWLDASKTGGGCLYFAVVAGGRPVGQCFLHDIEPARREAMVGYHLFLEADRGRGHGSAALGALCSYAFATMGLARLVGITDQTNVRSRRMLEKCRFRFAGTAREGEHLVVYELLSEETVGT